MSQRKAPKTPREQFMRAVEDELAKSERREIAFQKAERDERAAKLRLPLSRSPNSPAIERAAEVEWS